MNREPQSFRTHSLKFERSILEFKDDCTVRVQQNMSGKKHFSLDEMFEVKNIRMTWIRAITDSSPTLDNKLLNCVLVCKVLISRSGPNLPGN